MSSINVGSVVMDARLNTNTFARDLSSMIGAAKSGFAVISGAEPSFDFAQGMQMPDFSGFMDSLTQTTAQAEVLQGVARDLVLDFLGVGGAADVLTAAVQLGGGQLGGMRTVIESCKPAFEGMMAAQGKAADEGVRTTGLLESRWNMFRQSALGAASAVADGAVVSSARASSTLSGMLQETGNASAAWQSEYNAGVLGSNDMLIQNIQGAWQGSLSAWNGLGKNMANGTIGTMNQLSNVVVRGISGLVNMVGNALMSVGTLFGKDWGWNMPSAPPKIPFLARGGIVSQPTLAMIGERGSEAVLPLERNTGWISALAGQVAAAVGGHGGGSSAPASVNLYVDGRRLAEATISDFQSVASRRGIALSPSRG